MMDWQVQILLVEDRMIIVQPKKATHDDVEVCAS